MKSLLCITPDLKRSGAPIALLRLMEILICNKELSITLLTYGNGDLFSSYIDLIGEDHIIILNGLNPTEEFREMLQTGYDIILLNTSTVYTFAFYFQNLNIPVYWWIHEAPEMIESSLPAFPNPHLLSPNFRLFLPSKGAAECFHNHYNYNVSILHVPVNKPLLPVSGLPVDIPDDRILFLMPSAYSYIKGQDILLSAILSLPQGIKNRSYFIFCGYSLDKQIEFKNTIFKIATNIDNVLMLEDLSQDILFALMNKCHCIVAPSRIDTIPLTIVEGLMYKKLCLVSDKTGISAYIKDCVNGFVFKDEEELIKRLLLIINDCSSLNSIADNGHKIYIDHFSPEAVSRNINEVFRDI
ncbi:MAG: glycosyltransferase family 4 protein [Lachnospiraceae bacterium]|nr:glycosyltransferase family 4 protein [Lachnospiraceae bacterium]